FLTVALVLTFVSAGFCAERPPTSTTLTARPVEDSAFSWPYYLYIPPTAAEKAAAGDTLHLLVSTNNTGRTTDSYIEHETAAMKLVSVIATPGYHLGCPCLVPVFPRPAAQDSIYTHALDRDCLITEVDGLERLDLQLIAMIDDARSQLKERGWKVSSKVLIIGFSASGMFANRFTILHPDRVLAAAVGAPGGWPIAPVKQWQGHALPYPVGVDDLSALVGQGFMEKAYREVPHFFFMGGKDENDSVVFRDGYSKSDEDIVLRLFGETPRERWSIAEKIYAFMGARAEFRLYTDAGHEISERMNEDIARFFKEALARSTKKP
ncbi:MAG: hypothetical protein ABIJ00_16065, partial [Candidatus Eisenbacteria bacterium]